MSNQKRSPADGFTPKEKITPVDKTKLREKLARLKHWLIYALKFFTGLLIAEVIEEFIGARTGWFLWNVLPKALTAIAGTVSLVFSGCFSAFTDKDRAAFFKTVTRPDGMSSWEHAPILLKKIWIRYIYHNTLIFIIICGTVALCLPAYCASIGVARQMLDTGSQGLKLASTLLTPVYSEDKEFGDDGTSYFETATPNPPSPQPTNEKIISPSPSETTEYPLIPLSMRLRLLPGMDYEISNEERNEIFFQTGDFAIEDWDNNETILSNVRDFVEAQRKLHRKAVYGEDEIPSTCAANISSASADEDKMLKDANPTSDQLRNVIDTRETAYRLFPFYALATLTRESFCMYGDAIHLQGGVHEDAAVLFMKSILYGFEALQYDVDTEEFANNLEILSERFQKLANVLTDSNESQYALHLAKAFQTLSQEFS